MEEELKLLGLNNKDIKVFLATLELGESSASEIAKKSKLSRSSIYDILERLEKEGLISYTIKDYKKYFIASDPKTILENLDYKRQRIKDILPKLEQIKNKDKEEILKSEVYTGKNGMKTILNLILKEKEVFVLGASRKTNKVIPFFLSNWMNERVKRNIRFKVIYNDTPEIRKSIGKAKDYLHTDISWDLKFLSVNYLSEVMTVIFGNKVMLARWKKENPSAILIKDRDIAETYKDYFKKLWKQAKK